MTEGPGGDLDPEAALDRLGTQWLDGRTPRQEAIAAAIYQRLRDGTEVDDVKDLIAQLSRTATADAQERDRAGEEWKRGPQG